MKRTLIFAALALWAGAAPASQCEIDMKAIDAVLARKPAMDPAVLAKVKRLRAQGESYCNTAGKEEDGMGLLSKAKELIEGAGGTRR